jgi:hypothetical protein
VFDRHRWGEAPVSEFVPLYLLPLTTDVVAPRSGDAAKALVLAAAEAPEESGLRTDVSADWWHPRLVGTLSRACSIIGLGFLANDLRVLTTDEAAQAGQAAEDLLGRLESCAVPSKVDVCQAHWAIIQQEELAEVIKAAVPCFDVDAQNGEASSFIEFLVAIQLACQEVVEQGGRLLYFRPDT